jgi:two-component system response regulator MprA
MDNGPAPMHATESAHQGERRAGTQPRLLLVDDDRLVRMSLSLTLMRAGFTLDVATCAGEAFGFLDRTHYQLVVTDIGLPDQSGLEVLRAAKRADPDTKVILVTGSVSNMTPEDARREGAEGLLLKPFALKDLIERVRDLVSGGNPQPDPLSDCAPEPR